MPTVTIPAIFGILAVLVVVALNATGIASRRRLLHRERMKAIDKGLPPPEDAGPDLELDVPAKSVASHAGLHGTIWTSIGVGLIVASLLGPRRELGSDMVQMIAFVELWAIPALFVGIGLLIFAFVMRERRR